MDKSTVNGSKGFSKIFSIKGILAVVLGVALLVSSFFLGVYYSNQENEKSLLSLENSSDSKDDDSTASSNGSLSTGSGSDQNDVKQFTLATLTEFNGKNGAKSYVAYKGVIYDISTSPQFANGVHVYDARIKAGTDITALMAQAPKSHNQNDYISAFPKVGVLVEKITTGSTSLPSSSAVSNESSSAGTSGSGTIVKQFTLATLAAFNGKNGAKSYVAYKGIIYDISSSSQFVNGVHVYDARIKAGTDITAIMAQAPKSHNQNNYISSFPKVGVLVAKITTGTVTLPSSSAASSGSSSNSSSNSGTIVKEFTLATLAAFNGKNGAKSYVAYKGIIYDISSSSQFVNGVHTKDSRIKAGTDITALMAQAPASHNQNNYISAFPKVGVLVAKITTGSAPLPSSSVTSSLVSSFQSEIEDESEDDD